MIDWLFTLNPDTDNVTSEEPTGWDNAAISIIRDKKNHGISIAFSISELGFDGEAATFLKEQKRLYGIAAEVFLKVQAMCDDEVQYEETFRLDFMRYSEQCGDDCRINIAFEQISCFSTFKSNYEKSVDVDSELALDGSTALTPLAELKKNITLPAKSIKVIDRGELITDNSTNLMEDLDWPCDGCTDDGYDGYLLPPLPEIKYSSFGSFSVEPIVTILRNCGGNNHPPYPDNVTVNTTELLNIPELSCGLSNGRITFRMKGRVTQDVHGAGNPGILLRTKVFRLPAGGDGGDCGSPGDWVELFSEDLIDTRGLGDGTHEFDQAIDIQALPIVQGELYHFGFYYAVQRVSQIDAMQLEFDGGETFFAMEAAALCEDSTADVYMIFETINRIAEATSNKCLQLKSYYLGRTDSEPTAYTSDGCGALKAITSGLKVRNAPDAKFFMSMKESLDELNKIDSVGFALMEDENGDEVLRVEEAGFFYQDEEILSLDYVNEGKKSVIPEEHYGNIKFGYSRWEAERIAGLDEFLSTREYRSSIQQASALLDIISTWIAAGYLWEFTRQQTFAETGAADTKFDNNTFIVCLMRSYGNIIVEQGVSIIEDSANLFDPDTLYNYRISPIRNLMRWFNVIAGQFVDATVNTNKFIFSAGTGNYIAEGKIDDSCSPEGEVMSENEDVSLEKFKDADTGLPLFRPELITFEYPMSLADFVAIRANPYGYINYQCGVGEFKKAFIMNIKYQISNGKASFELKEKYE